MSQLGDGRSDAGSNTKLQDEIVSIDINGDPVVTRSAKDLVDAGGQTQPQTNQQHESQSEFEPQPQPQPQEGHDWLKSNARVKFAIYKAANKGHWKTAKVIYEALNISFDATINVQRQTALHIAALAGQTQFARELIDVMSPDGLRQQDSDGNTAVFFAVVSGKRSLVEAIVQKNEGLAMLKKEHSRLPIHDATFLGRKDIVTYLYGVCKDKLENADRADLLVSLIDADMYDTALELATGEWFATCREGYKVDVLHALARKPHFSANTSSQIPLSRASSRCFINPFRNITTSSRAQKNNLHQSAYELVEYICNKVPSDDKEIRRSAYELAECIYNLEASDDKEIHQSAYKLAEYICDQVASDDKEISYLKWLDWWPIFVAAEHGNVEFLRMLIEKLPDVVMKTNEKGKTIFHVAVLFRRAEVFDLLSEMGFPKYLIARFTDLEGNNTLHLAGERSHSDYLDAVPGAALQLQRELLWFERVKKAVGPAVAEAKNNGGETPDDVFMKHHRSMIKEGEEWMKKTADSCTIVAALVATVVFAAAFTAPGGNDQTTGFPMFLNEASFKIFIVSDAISLISALSSLLTFMSIQTSTYSLKDFKWSLPMKLLTGYSTLFISIAAMMVAFVTVLFVYFREHQLLSVALPLTLVAAFPIGLFARLHYRLLAGMIMFWQALKNIHH